MHTLTFERHCPLTPEQIWRAYTTPALLMQWFCPKPWQVVDCELDLRPGGAFNTTMQSPEGQRFPNQGCYLELQPPHRLVWTNALGPNYAPAEDPKPCITAIIEMRAVAGGGTHFHATCLHKNAADRAEHEAMGFQQGWGQAYEQMVELMQSME